jgi:hypothetical protein
LHYREIGRLGEQLARALKRVERERMHVILFDDFQRETARVYGEVLRFLELPPDGRTNFQRVNANAALRSRWLRKLLDHRRVPESLRRWGRRIGLHKLHRVVRGWNENPTNRTPLETSFRGEVAEAFRDDVGLLSDLLQRDLSPWLAA